MSCNLMTSRASVDVKNSDTQSEVSESGTCTSGWNSNWDSREELQDFVIKIGLNDVSDLYQDRFKVDRKKLEQMLSGDNEALIPADVFFEKVMEDTDTFIRWPNKLKIGAKSKKDPHVRIAGRPDDVAAAKERIMTILDTRCNRITMKMDVSYTDHSHIIGKGGYTIKRVMEETQCHVHFPDSNRSNPTEKSNQVSISGDIEGAESARSRVRELIPLIFGFELPIMSQNFDSNCPYVMKIQDQYKVQVIFKTRPKLHASLVLVKGVEWEVDQVKQATLLLMDFMCEKLASQTPVQMSMEISPHHHQTVLGKNHSNLKAIMQYTNCQIMFPDAQDPNIPSLKKSNVSISGNIHQVYQARQLLMGSLPLLVIFDLPEDTTNLRIKPEQIMEIQNQCDVVINIRGKAKQTTKACVIKGIEKHVLNIYKARNLILNIDEPPIKADIPSSYHLPSTGQNQFPSTDLLPTPTSMNHSPISPLLSPLVTPTWQYPNMPGTPNASFVGMTQQPQFYYNMMQQSMGSSGYSSMLTQSMHDQSAPSRDNQNYSGSSLLSNSFHSPNGKPASPTGFRSGNDCLSNKSGISSVHSELSDNYHCSPEKKQSWDYSLTPNDYENKRIAALRAMQQKPSPGMVRTPTNAWSGYGVSHTSPAGFLSAEKARIKKEEEIWKSSAKYDNYSDNFNMPSTSGANLNTSNILDHTPARLVSRVTSSNWTDVASILTSIGLDDRYVNLLNSHEIDLTTFATLNDEDLAKIGVRAFGARKKMLLAIAELNKRSCPFSAAPGAERKSSSISPVSPRESNW
ncbi:protein bicaudal C [Coccinella septempunctata]|uniref:protein bicaudal C n=1 Tax=Coccinella septempunctata TaxID=41139 RepID=UPI001D05DA66|nr:protein bicaudal C [Coccinella septempunctata]